MVKQVSLFQTSSGKNFDNAFDAWAQELESFLFSNGAENEAIARKIVTAISKGQPETLATLADIVKNLQECAPTVVLPAETLA